MSPSVVYYWCSIVPFSEEWSAKKEERDRRNIMVPFTYQFFNYQVEILKEKYNTKLMLQERPGKQNTSV